MSHQEYQSIQSEISTVRQLLSRLPAENVIDRMSLEAREAELGSRLANLVVPAKEPARACLTFRGTPVVGTQGVFSAFAADAMKAFSEAVAAIGASIGGNLGARGTIPGRDEYELLITGSALGSFGFELEEAPKQGQIELDLPGPSLVETALIRTQGIMEATLGSDDELADALSDTDPRAIDALRKFLSTLDRNDATCAFEFQNKLFRFADSGQLKRSLGRLQQDNIHEKDIELCGALQGVLPNKRTFEFTIEESKETVIGKVAADIENAAELNKILGQRIRAKFHSRRIGNGRPRYALYGYHNTDSS